jgi:hypothetical protein
MKVARILLFSLLAVVVLIGAAAILAFNPGFQTWAARKALAGDPAIQGSIGRVDGGLKRIEVEDLRIARSGMTVTVPRLSIDLPVARALKKDIRIDKLVAKGWILDLTSPAFTAEEHEAGTGTGASSAQAAPKRTQAEPARTAQGASSQPAAAAPGKAAFDGIFDLLNLPVDIELDAAELEGDVIFVATPGEPPSRAHVVISGGGLGAGREGHFKIFAKVQVADAKTPLNELSSETTLALRMDTPRSFDSVAASSEVDARGSQLPNGAQLQAEVRAARAATSEDYSILLRSKEGGGKELINVQANLPKNSRLLTGTWKIDARDADLTPFTLGKPMPTFLAVGEGRFQTDSSFGEVHASGSFNADLAKLENLSPTLAVLGAVKVQGDFDLVQTPEAIRIDRLNTSVAGKQPLLRLEALQPVEFVFASKEFTVADAKKELFRARIDGVPLQWARPFLPSGIEISGEDLRGEIVGISLNGGLGVRTIAPLHIGGLSISQDQQPLLRQVDLRMELAGEYGAHGWQADITELSLGKVPNAWFTAALKVGEPSGGEPLKATGQYSLQLAEAGRQPALQSLAVLTAGRATGEFSAVLGESLQQYASTLNLRGLATAGATTAIPSVTGNLRADVQSDGLVRLQAPLVVQLGDRKSDLDTVAEIRSSGETRTIDAHIRSELLYVEDLQLFGALGGKTAPAPAPRPNGAAGNGPAPQPAPAGGSSGKADTKPFWSGLAGQVHLELKKVVYSADVQAANVVGELKIGPDAITLDNLRAVMGEGSSAKVNGGLSFNAAAKDPYTLDANVNVANVDPGPLLAALSPTRQPTVEGAFDLVGKFSGEASSVDALAGNTAAELKLTSRGGKFHGFAGSAKGADFAKYQKAASTVGSLLEMAAGVLGSDAANFGEKIRAASDTVKRLVDIDFDQLNLELSHRPGQDLAVTDFSLISPDLRLVSSGSIDTVTGVDWLDRPLKLEVQMAVRGEQAKNFAKLNLLKNTQDPLGYVPLLEKFLVTGSLSNLGTDALMKLLNRAFASGK